jgi:hypothetical protein
MLAEVGYDRDGGRMVGCWVTLGERGFLLHISKFFRNNKVWSWNWAVQQILRTELGFAARRKYVMTKSVSRTA